MRIRNTACQVYLARLTCLSCPVQMSHPNFSSVAVLLQLFCPFCLVRTFLSWLYYPSCHPWLLCPSSPAQQSSPRLSNCCLSLLSWTNGSLCLVQADLEGQPVQTDLSQLFCLGYPFCHRYSIPSALFLSGWTIPTFLSRMSCPDSTFPLSLSQMSCSSSCPQLSCLHSPLRVSWPERPVLSLSRLICH